MKLILASTSSYRTNIFNQAFLKHIAVASEFEEKSDKRDNPEEYVKELSMGKAKNVAAKFSDSIIVGMDTVVVAGGEILEKPKDFEQARRHIRLCSDSTADVITGVTIINQINGEVVNVAAHSKVSFVKIPEEEIEFYLNNEKYALKSAGFVIETALANFIKTIEGTYNNVLGAPVEVVYSYLSKWGYSLKDFQD